LGSSRGSIPPWLNLISGLHCVTLRVKVMIELKHMGEHMGEHVFCMPYSEHRSQNFNSSHASLHQLVSHYFLG
jgi:hypothetical protein